MRVVRWYLFKWICLNLLTYPVDQCVLIREKEIFFCGTKSVTEHSIGNNVAICTRRRETIISLSDQVCLRLSASTTISFIIEVIIPQKVKWLFIYYYCYILLYIAIYCYIILLVVLLVLLYSSIIYFILFFTRYLWWCAHYSLILGHETQWMWNRWHMWHTEEYWKVSGTIWSVWKHLLRLLYSAFD